MNIQKAVEIAGSKSKLAKILGISRAAVTMWDEIPQKRLNQLKEIKEWQTHFNGEPDKIPSDLNSSASVTGQQ
jgi:hypothetical protein